MGREGERKDRRRRREGRKGGREGGREIREENERGRRKKRKESLLYWPFYLEESVAHHWIYSLKRHSLSTYCMPCHITS